MELPIVVNRHWYKNGKPIPDPWIYIGRGTPLGNPYVVGEQFANPLELYRRWLWEKLKTRDKKVVAAMRAIVPGMHLVCSCKPRPCHGDVVVRAWVWMQDHEDEW